MSDGSATHVYGTGSERLRALDGSWFLGDALGSVCATLDDVGAVLATASYAPWGTPQGYAMWAMPALQALPTLRGIDDQCAVHWHQCGAWLWH